MDNTHQILKQVVHLLKDAIKAQAGEHPDLESVPTDEDYSGRLSHIRYLVEELGQMPVARYLPQE